MNEMTCAALFHPTSRLYQQTCSNILPYPGNLSIRHQPTEPESVQRPSDPRGALPDGLGVMVV